MLGCDVSNDDNFFLTVIIFFSKNTIVNVMFG
jgi:hypothetical protein